MKICANTSNNPTVSVISRTAHFVSLELNNSGRVIEDFETFDDFVKFLYDNNFKNHCEFNKNKKGYIETLEFIYSFKKEK